MKKLALLSIIFGSSIFCYPLFSQNNENNASLGLPGDNLNLYGVLNLFQQSATLEIFEQKLNAEDSQINNLDLDGDGRTDYIKVIDHVNGNAHSIVLQDIFTANESQDVAVIEVQRGYNDQILIQIIGDEQLYGKDYIVEPVYETPNPGYNGNQTVTVTDPVYAPASWSIIRFIFAPSYVVYVSPWRWSYYPSYWHPWHQMYYNDYYAHWNNHQSYTYYHQAHSYRVPDAHSYYGPRRTSSVVVRQRIEKGEYKRNYTRSNTDSKRENNNYRKSQNNDVKKYNQPTRVENRNTTPQRNSTINRGTPDYNKSTPSVRPERKTDIRPATRETARPAARETARPAARETARPAARETARPATRQNARPAAKQNATPDNKQEKAKDSRRN